MPTSKEVISNRPLAGVDLAKIILRDIAFMLDQDGMLSGQIAYNRCSYSINLKLHLDNPVVPHHEINLVSRPPAVNQLDDPALSKMEGPPPLLSATPEAMVTDRTRERVIDSPNVARVEAGLPILVDAPDQSGHMQEHELYYPPSSVEHVSVPPVDTDNSAETAQAWGGQASGGNLADPDTIPPDPYQTTGDSVPDEVKE